jgi:hypothetical protein
VGNLIVLDESRVRRVQVSDGSVRISSPVESQDGSAVTVDPQLPRCFNCRGESQSITQAICISRTRAITGYGALMRRAESFRPWRNGTRGSSGDSAAALQAGLAYPDAIAIDETGNLFISQCGYDPGALASGAWKPARNHHNDSRSWQGIGSRRQPSANGEASRSQ